MRETTSPRRLLSATLPCKGKVRDAAGGVQGDERRSRARQLLPSLPQGGGSPPQRRGGVLPRLALTLIFVLSLLALPSPNAAASSNAAPLGIGELYVALGDSLGVGLLTSTPDARGYVAQFHALLEQRAGRAVAVQNFSISGETTATLIANGQLVAAERAIDEARRRGWTISPVTIDIGGNDLRDLQNSNDAAREAGVVTFRANLAQIFDRLIAATTVNGVRRGDIVTMTVYNPYGGDPAIVRSDAWWVERFNAVIVEEAQRRAIPVADVYRRFKGRERELTWVPLDFHANNRGHLAMAEEFWRAAGYDTTTPTAEIVDPAEGTVRRAVPTIKVRASDDISVARVELFVNEQPLAAPVYARDFDLWIGYWDARAAAPGQHRLAVVVTDAAGKVVRREAVISR